MQRRPLVVVLDDRLGDQVAAGELADVRRHLEVRGVTALELLAELLDLLLRPPGGLVAARQQAHLTEGCGGGCEAGRDCSAAGDGRAEIAIWGA